MWNGLGTCKLFFILYFFLLNLNPDGGVHGAEADQSFQSTFQFLAMLRNKKTFASQATPSTSSENQESFTTRSNDFIDLRRSSKCPPIAQRFGLQVECRSGSSQNNCHKAQYIGTKVTYKCQRDFEPSKGTFLHYQKCQAGGTWSVGDVGFSCSLECGSFDAGTSIRDRIIGGESTQADKWPWHAALFHNDGYICGGTLIGRKALLTAAHCVTKLNSRHLNTLSGFRIDLGRAERTRNDDFVQTFSAKSIIRYPSYNPTHYYSDIALIILNASVSVGSRVSPICFPQQANSDLEDLLKSTGTVVGFGKTEDGEPADILQLAQFKLHQQEECTNKIGEVGTEHLAELMKTSSFCAIVQNGTNVCQGDSGGGMYFPVEQAVGLPRKWYLQGLVSFSLNKDRKVGRNKCDPKGASVFTKIDFYADWILKLLWENKAW